MTDNINHPPHYTGHPSGVECIDITEHFNFNLGNAIKYLWRADSKGQATADLQKAAWYINRELNRREIAAATFPKVMQPVPVEDLRFDSGETPIASAVSHEQR